MEKEPVAVTENEAVWPAVTVWLAGWLVIVTGEFTVNDAVLLETLPAALVATTEYCEPLSAVVVTGVV